MLIVLSCGIVFQYKILPLFVPNLILPLKPLDFSSAIWIFNILTTFKRSMLKIMSKSSKSFIIILLFLFILIRPNIAHAYVDPGTGTLLFQMAIAVIVGSLFFLKNLRTKIVKFIRGVFSKSKE